VVNGDLKMNLEILYLHLKITLELGDGIMQDLKMEMEIGYLLITWHPAGGGV
tara:strand:- start:473 stop:628 length:156 start_codon:yes stop_codon:yes gene_type:complete